MRTAGESVARQRRASGSGGLAAVRGISDERAYLYGIIRTIGSGPDLDTVLRGTVHLVTEATGCHACFIYFVRDRELELRAASTMYAHLEGQVRIDVGEGLTGWVAKTRRSAFIQENALEDPRVRSAVFPELEDERFQSLISVPIFSRSNDVIGVITLHADAPHEFAGADLDLLEHTASLIAGAVDNGRLYEEATARVSLLTDLSKLSQQIASAGSVDQLLTKVATGCREFLGAARCEIHLLDGGDRLSLGAASPEPLLQGNSSARRLELADLGTEADAPPDFPSLARRLWGKEADGAVALFAPLADGRERLGAIAVLAPRSATDAQSALAAVASQTALAIRRHQLIDSLKEKNLVKDFFEALSTGRAGSDELGTGRAGSDELGTQAARLGCDLEAPHVVVHLLPWKAAAGAPQRRGGRRADPGDGPKASREFASRIESSLAVRFPGALIDRRERSIRALLPVASVGSEDPANVIRELQRKILGDDPGVVSIGLSNPCSGAASFRQGFDEAASAAQVGGLIRGGPGVATYEDLGPYRYVLGSEHGVRDRHQQRLERLVDYDRSKGTRLLDTLEAHLDHRGNIVGTARALYIHPNTLRQRLARIEHVAGLDLEREEWLSLAVAVKIVKLRMMRKSAEEEGRSRDG